MNKNYIWIAVLVLLVIGGGVWWYINKSNEDKVRSDDLAISAQRLATEVQVNKELTQNAEISNNIALNEELNRKANPPETEIGSYSTKLKDRSAGRLTNIRITCSALNGKKVSAGETFSFCDVVGPSTEAKGYKKASVIIDQKSVQALGGGNCQVSSTLYNAVLASPGLTVTERHEHGKQVTYVPDGKDAAVSYSSLDFKFKNTSNDDIKLYVSSDDKNVSVRIVKLR